MGSRMTVTKADIGYSLSIQANIPNKLATEFVDVLLDTVSDSLKRGEAVKWANFATFSVSLKNARPGRNLHTDTEITIPQRYVVVFRPSENLKYYVGANHSMDKMQYIEAEKETVVEA